MAAPVQALLRSRVVAALTSPHGVDRYLEQVNPMWAATEVRARVVDVHRENPGSDAAPVATLTLQPTSTWRGHRAGQYVQVGVDLPGSARRMTRCFTISSAASMPGERITLTVRAHAEGQVSQHLVTAVRPGQMLHLSQAQGDFTLAESPATPTNNHLLFVTAGSGITPAMSILRTLLRDGYDGRAGRRVTFLHYAQSAADQVYADELAAVADADNDVTVHLRHAASGDPLVSELELQRVAPGFRDLDTWMCGPAGFMDAVTAAYGDSPRLRTEQFKLAPAPTGGSAEGDVVFARSGQEAANTGATLLEQAEALGLKPEFGCRMGICFTCTTRKTEGTVRHVRTGASSSLPDEEIQICVSAPEGDCTIEL